MAACISSGAVQALADIALVLLTGATLVVLRRYTNLTGTIAAESVKQTTNSATQTENAQRPFLSLTLVEGRQGIVNGWKIENQGAGPALNIRYTIPAGQAQEWRTQISLAVGGLINYNPDVDVALQHGLTIEYASLSGATYRTVVTGTTTAPETTFQRTS